jgi:NRPS condensation-like uncharacterized protein
VKKNNPRTETCDLMQYFYTTVHDPVIRALLRFSGRLDPGALKRAVDLSAGAVPQIRCCFSQEKHKWEDRGFTAEQIVHIVDAGEGEDPSDRLMLSAIAFFEEPHLKIYLVRGREADSLCVVISHLVADGVGLKQYLTLLAELYGACEAGLDPAPPLPGDRSVRQLSRALRLGQKRQILSSRMDYEKQNPSMYLPFEEGEGEPFCVLRRIEPERFSELHAYAKSRGATLNDLLLAAYFRAHHTLTGCPKLVLPCPVDARKYLPDASKCGVCNLTSSYMVRLSVGENDPFDKTLRSVSEQMSAQKNSLASLKGPLLLDFLFRMLPYSATRKMFFKTFYIPFISFTNIGVLKPELLRFGRTEPGDASLTPAVKKAPLFQVSVSSFAGRCTLSSNMEGSQQNRQVVETFYDLLFKELDTLLL